MFVRVKDPNGTEALVTLEAYELVHKENGFSLVEDEPKLGNEPSESKPTKKATKK